MKMAEIRQNSRSRLHRHQFQRLKMQISFTATSTPISMTQKTYADVCSQKDGDPKEHQNRVTGGKPTPKREEASRRGRSFREANNAKGPRRREKRRKESTFSKENKATQNEQGGNRKGGRYESMLEFLNVNVKRARRPSTEVFETS